MRLRLGSLPNATASTTPRPIEPPTTTNADPIVKRVWVGDANGRINMNPQTNPAAKHPSVGQNSHRGFGTLNSDVS
jgi:hypothetical protein